MGECEREWEMGSYVVTLFSVCLGKMYAKHITCLVGKKRERAKQKSDELCSKNIKQTLSELSWSVCLFFWQIQETFCCCCCNVQGHRWDQHNRPTTMRGRDFPEHFICWKKKQSVGNIICIFKLNYNVCSHALICLLLN